MIYVDGRLLLQSLTGVNRFAYELCRVWVQVGTPFILCCPSGPIKGCYNVSHFNIVVYGWGKSHVQEQLLLSLWFSRIKGEEALVCFTGLGPLLIRKKIMTIHGLTFMANPDWYSRSYRLWYRLMTPPCVVTSMKILTVSEFPKSGIVRRLSIDDREISVIYNVVSSLPCVSGSGHRSAREVTGEKHILAVFSIDPRKNFSMLLKAFARVDDKNIKLYIAGGQVNIYSTSIKELCDNIPTDRIKWLGRITDCELKEHYMNSCCFTYPPLYEGFGTPPLEAMVCDTPTIVSDTPPLREIYSNASLYTCPLDTEDITKKIMLSVSDTKLREKLRIAGYNQYKKLAWKDSANAVYDLLCSLQINKQRRNSGHFLGCVK